MLFEVPVQGRVIAVDGLWFAEGEFVDAVSEFGWEGQEGDCLARGWGLLTAVAGVEEEFFLEKELAL